MSLLTKRPRGDDTKTNTAIFTGLLPEMAPQLLPSKNNLYFKNLEIHEAVKRCLSLKDKIIHVFESEGNRHYKYISFSENKAIRINPKTMFTDIKGDAALPPGGATKTVRTVDLFVYEKETDTIRLEESTSLIAVKWRKPTALQPQLLLDHLFQNEIRWLQKLSASEYIPSLQAIVTYQSFSVKERRIILLPRYPATLRDYINTPIEPEKKCILRKNLLQSCSILGKNVHRDLSPDNLFVKEDLSVVIGDLGGMMDPTDQNILEGLLLGSVHYVAPEIARIMLDVRESPKNKESQLTWYRKLITPAIDAFSLGKILYELRIEEDGLPDGLFDLNNYAAVIPGADEEKNTLTARASLQGIGSNYPHFFEAKPLSLSPFGVIVWDLLRPVTGDRLPIEEAITQFELSRGGFVPVG